MKSDLTARDIMVTKLVTLRPGMDIFEAIDLLLKHRISGAPVVDHQKNYLGIFSERCCMSILVEAAYDQLPTSQIDGFVDRNAATISEEADLFTIAHVFRDTHFRRLPVLRDGVLVGQISRRDVLKAIHSVIKPTTGHESALLYLSSLLERDQQPIV
ncbi:Inosine-5'-monophosphate dehydrogenase [Polystyrenella longa]|uniref:Inosine-5'-monophosphate dehydrogenase n=1 Tax=Polystyrenella longa TaxID=2528007 RepID=A0A518CUD1_9PLAN|nr:CBS domain-containing protein [Polystyrenella longa]QDU82832.1 Inosine-5'-monophosphate dehydrogenase [Polystyrenella longa]